MSQSAYTTAVLADSPAAFWKFDEASGLPQDSSGNANHFTTTTGSPTYQQTGPFSGSYGILFADASVQEMFSRAVFNTAVDNITLELWANGQAKEPRWAVFNGHDNFHTGVSLRKSGTNNIEIIASAGTTPLSPTILGVGAGGWHMLVAIRRAGTWELYLDGDLFSTAGTTAPDAPTGLFEAGLLDGSANNTVGCMLSNIVYYGSALSASRIRAHYEAGMDYVIRPLRVTPAPVRLV